MNKLRSPKTGERSATHFFDEIENIILKRWGAYPFS